MLRRLIPRERWDAFVAWTESFDEGEELCSHDEESYIDWLEKEGVAQPGKASAELYAAIASYGEQAGCACVAGSLGLRSPHSDA